jgi:hypothetical protein
LANVAIVVSRQDAVDQVPLEAIQLDDINQGRLVIDPIWEFNPLPVYLNHEMTDTMRICRKDRNHRQHVTADA